MNVRRLLKVFFSHHMASHHSTSLLYLLLLLGGTIGIGFYFQWTIITEGWPFLIILLCPLMHLFGGHHHGSDEDSHKKSR